jgi:primosomal protein N' (replication factor Y)
MHYYEVLVGDMQYHGSEALTYSSEQALNIGAIVRVTLRNRPVLAIVTGKVSKPVFTAKPVAAVSVFRPLPTETLELLDWLRSYYPAPLGAAVRQFLPPTTIFPKVAAPLPQVKDEAISLPALTAEQAQALEAIQGPGSFLLHGITGSGKSRVYVELARRSIDGGKSAIILTPEIGLAAQLTETFRATFGSSVYVLHSQLTAANRRDVWYSLLQNQKPVVVIGPRSALFSPLKSVGLIVLDEAHDSAYKNESAPHYHAARVAAKLAMLHGATYVSGSATPAVEDYYVATEKHRPIVQMRALAKTTASELRVDMVDLKNRELFTRSPLLSNALLEQISAGLGRNEQSLLFLNRRGTANVVLCSTCGWQTQCPNCDLSLTYHGDEHRLRCHVCGYTSNLPTSCPVCENTEILYKSVGTKAVLEEVERLFPSARVQRFDTDLKKGERLAEHVSALAGGSADIIVGTQMITKGLDLPRLSVVGIISADSSLLIPDYTAAEQTFQLISQVVGRVGRGHRAGSVVVQTYDPENVTLKTAVNRDWQQFYDNEIAERRTYHFPPFTYLLKLRCLRATSKSAEKATQALADSLAKQYPGLTIDGPTPSFHPRERGKYSWQLLLKASRRQVLVNIATNLPSGWSYDIDPVNLL